jgi:tRNA pseudouridine38-40 synthase
MRYFLELSYNGTEFSGWQRQPNAPSVQETLEHALSLLTKRPAYLTGSGRTDAGVHAEQQFAHWDTEPIDAPETLVFKLNKFLPPSIAVYRLFPVAPDTHARFSATSRTYEYWITRRKSPFRTHLAYQFDLPLDLAAMNDAAAILLRHEDFQSFSRVHTEVNHFRCRLTQARWEARGDLLVFHVRADRFLRGMVRALVGTLLDVGLGKTTLANLEAILQARDRRRAGRAAPPQGLFLTSVEYPEGSFQL